MQRQSTEFTRPPAHNPREISKDAGAPRRRSHAAVAIGGSFSSASCDLSVESCRETGATKPRATLEGKRQERARARSSGKKP